MDIQKERELFESVFTEAKGWDLTFIMGCYQNIETFRAFAGWLAAKSQAVPEGFVLLPLVATKQMVNAGYEAHDGFFTNGQVQDVYQAMIEAQEQNQ